MNSNKCTWETETDKGFEQITKAYIVHAVSLCGFMFIRSDLNSKSGKSIPM